MGERSATSARLRASCVFRPQCPRGDSRPRLSGGATLRNSDRAKPWRPLLDSTAGGGCPHVGCATRRSVAPPDRWGHLSLRAWRAAVRGL